MAEPDDNQKKHITDRRIEINRMKEQVIDGQNRGENQMKKTKGMQRLWAFLPSFVLIATTVGNDGLTVLASENETEQSSEASSETHSAETSENTNSGGEEETPGKISQIRKR